MQSTVDIVRTLVENFAPSSEIESITSLGSNLYRLQVCKMFNTRPLRQIRIDGSTYYDVTAIDATNKTITISSTTNVTGSTYTPPAVVFFHGTPIATNLELSKIQDTKNKIPMVYLLEIIEDKRYPDRQNARDRDSQLRLFFLDEANYAEWDTDGHYDGAIMPMANYAEEFLDKYCYTHKQLDKFEPYTLVYHPKFNPQINFNGVLTSLFPDAVSGVEAKLTLPIRKSFVCNC